MGGNEYGNSSHMSIFTSLVLLMHNLSGFHIYALSKTMIARRAMQLRFLKVKTLLNNAFNIVMPLATLHDK